MHTPQLMSYLLCSAFLLLCYDVKPFTRASRCRRTIICGSWGVCAAACLHTSLPPRAASSPWPCLGSLLAPSIGTVSFHHLMACSSGALFWVTCTWPLPWDSTPHLPTAAVPAPATLGLGPGCACCTGCRRRGVRVGIRLGPIWLDF